MPADLIRKFYRPTHQFYDRPDVFLNRGCIVGDMQSGKTTTVLSIFANIAQDWGDKFEVAHIVGRQYKKMFRIHENEDLVEAIKNAEVINVFVDDAAREAGSRQYSADKIANWFEVRHYFREKIGVKRGTLNWIYGVQRFNNLMNIMRNSPLLIFKAMPIMDVTERKAIMSILRGEYKYLRTIDGWVNDLHFGKYRTILEQNLVVPPYGAGPIYTQRIERRSLNGEVHYIDDLIDDKAKKIEREEKAPNVTCGTCGYQWHSKAKAKNPRCYKCGNRGKWINIYKVRKDNDNPVAPPIPAEA